jgi:serine/threonine-protein kinase RsbW
MAAHTKHVEMILATRLASINRAEKASLRVAAEAGFGDDDCHKISMAVREGVINAFQYGNRQSKEKKIHVVFDVTPEKLIVHVTDEGNGFKLASVPNPLEEENLLKTSGRGIFLMRALMDELDVRQGTTGGAEIVLSKTLPGVRGSGAPRNGNRPARLKGR